MAIPIIENWRKYFTDPHEGLGSSYERIVLNNKLIDVINEFGIFDILETPSFGFTGVSGINSMGIASLGCSIHLEDHDLERLALTESIWRDSERNATFKFNQDYLNLDYGDNSFDLLWNFSALWFVKDLNQFLAEATRIARKAIIFCVPNQTGLGFIMQKSDSSQTASRQIIIENINPRRITRLMRKIGWELREKSYIDCPPWPDIGMNKNEFLAKYCMLCRLRRKLCPLPNTPSAGGESESRRISILDYYQGKDRQFAERMMQYYFFEKHLPKPLKKYWAHHIYLLYTPNVEK